MWSTHQQDEERSDMRVTPRLKSVPVNRSGSHLVIGHRALERLHLDDEGGALTATLTLLADGTHEPAALTAELRRQGFGVSHDEVGAVLGQLDEMGLLEQADSDQTLGPRTRERHRSNLRFYDLFCDLSRSSADLQRTAMRAHVLLLGAGGLGSGVLQSLAGMGVGRVTLVDFDVVEPGNLARQFMYGTATLGRPKVEAAREWVRQYSPDTEVQAVNDRITDAQSIVDLAGDARLVVCAIDSPDDVHLIVNRACFVLGVPYVVGGLSYSTLSYWSVAPGSSPCRRCLELHRRDEEATQPDALRQPPIVAPPPVNRATGPVIQLASGLVSLEAMRYLVGTEPPLAAACYQIIELADRMATSRAPWRHHGECELCPGVRP
jgi:molybdopterin/thiamine biosynthesis adenylyltransferase